LEKAPDAFRIISEVASELDVPQHVLRFWESRFSQIRPMKRGGGRRYYRPDDIELLRGIRHLLYSEGYTIRGVQRLLKEQGVGFVQGAWQAGASDTAASNGSNKDDTPTARDRLLLNLLPKFGRAKRGPNAEELDVTEPDPDSPDDEVEADDEEDVEATTPSAEPRITAPKAVIERLGREQLKELQAALDELGECCRLIDATLATSD
jgi:DNA-binding transcriptional MerR regulator